MPTPSATFCNIKRLHAIFAVASAAMLAATVWMVAADHGREWKHYQRTFRDRIEPWTTQAAMEDRENDPSLPRENPAERTASQRLARVLAQQRPSFGKWFLGLPLIDAFARPLAIDQIWLPDLTIDYHFCQVARFDRCTTCHQGIDKTAAGSSAQPAYLPESKITVQLATPGRAPEIEPDDAESRDRTLLKAYGLKLAASGILDPAEVTIGLVVPKTPAAIAGLLAGDVVLAVNGKTIADRRDFGERLLNDVAWGKPLALEIRRGLPQPYCGHPRMDLYVGSQSPHPLAEFGCTICHDGQGSATEFKFAAHSPNDLDQRARWRKVHGWFSSRDWDFPMRPKRFVESNCLKCHHEVTDLEPSTRFPDPPAPKLLAGYQLVRQLGCFGCHELNGIGEGGRRIGPDLRLEPNYHEAAEGLLADPGLDAQQRRLAAQIVAEPDSAAVRRQLVGLLRGSSHLRRQSQALVGILAAESAVPGTLRKVGPSLRHVASRLDAAAIAAWIADPAGFRPTTRMPQMFGMHEHLDAAGRETVGRFEPVEIRAISEYLLAASQPAALAEPPAGITQTPSAERGKQLFRTQGCLACHRHKDFPQGQSTQGPDLSRYGAMLRAKPVGHVFNVPHTMKSCATEAPRNPDAAKWLASWIRDPSRDSPRTRMPSLMLESVGNALRGVPRIATDVATAAHGTPRRALPTDPAADIAAYLLASKGWEPKPLAPLVEADLDALALLYLRKTYPPEQAARYIRDGIPMSMAAQVPADAVELLGPMTPENRIGKKLRYVGRRSIRKRGCFGCHDVPGMEDALPIGPALSDWGRKQESQLAFENVAEFVDEAAGHGDGTGKTVGNALRGVPGSEVAASMPVRGTPRRTFPPGDHSEDHSLTKADRAFYREAIRAGRREGFIWQKLRAPRSFDFQRTANKSYNEHLLMGKFALSDAQREAIITFVLGLVAEPPKSRYVFHPDERGKAIVAGRKVLDEYGCQQCHTLQMERWTIEYDPAKFPAPPRVPEYDFLKPAISPQQVAASQRPDRRGLCRAELVGRPQVDAEGKPEETEDDDGNPQDVFTLWEPAVIAGKVWPVGGAGVLVSPRQIVAKRPAVGGEFARLLFPIAVAQAKAAGAAAAATEAWGWVPPALVHEGRTVQPEWLYEYLLDPRPIRPAAVLRMPKFTLSPTEARKLVDYFAAVAGVEFPYSSDARARAARRAAETPQESERLKRAMRFVSDRTTYCAKCHLVGDFSPGGEIRTTLAPNLQDVAARLRPEYLRRWLASPKSVLPYTAMPVNFPPDRRIGQEIYPGSSAEQLDAVMDLLLDYDGYVRDRVSIRQMIEAGGKGK